MGLAFNRLQPCRELKQSARAVEHEWFQLEADALRYIMGSQTLKSKFKGV